MDAGAANLASGLLGTTAQIAGIFTNSQNQKNATAANLRINREQLQQAWKMYEDQKQYNTWLLGNQKQLMMQDAKAAGANPAFAQGSLIGGQSSAPSGSIPSQIPVQYYGDPGWLALGNSLQQLPLLSQLVAQAEANTRATNAAAEWQELQNKLLKKENEEYANYTAEVRVHLPEGERKFDSQEEATEFLNNYNKEHKTNILPDITIIPQEAAQYSGAKGTFEARKQIREYKQEFKRNMAELKVLDAVLMQALLDKLIAEKQINDPDVITALTKMPYEEYRQLSETVTALVNDNSVFHIIKEGMEIDLNMKKLELKLQQDSNIHGLIEKWKDGGFEWSDILHIFANILMSLGLNIQSAGSLVRSFRPVPAPVQPTTNKTVNNYYGFGKKGKKD